MSKAVGMAPTLCAAAAAHTSAHFDVISIKRSVSADGRDRSLDWRKIGRVHVHRFRRLGEDLAVRFRFSRYLLPFWIVGELLPVLHGLLSAGVGDDVNEGIFRPLPILGNPVADALHAVALEDLDGVVTETRLEGFQFSFVTRVGAEFKHAALPKGKTGRQQG